MLMTNLINFFKGKITVSEKK